MIVNGDVLQIVANFTLPDGEQAKNVFYALVTDVGAGSQSGLRGDCRDWIDDILDGLGNLVSDSLVAGIIDIYRRNTATDQWDREGGSTLTWSSANPAEPVANQTTGVIFADTSNARVTSRKSFAALIAVELLTNSWSVAMQAALTAAAQRWINPINGGDLQITAGCWSKVNNDFFPFSGSGTTRVFSGSMDTRSP